jgi:hypothetical protein
MMKPRQARIFLFLTIAEAIGTLLYSISDPSDPESAVLFGFSFARLVMITTSLLILGLLVFLAIKTTRESPWIVKVTRCIDHFLIRSTEDDRKHLFLLQGGILLGMVASMEAFVLTWFAFPTPLRPFFIWFFLACLHTWLLIRITYSREYRERRTLLDSLRITWNNWTPVQRKVLITLCVIGLVYFLAFIPDNLVGSNADENIVIPDVLNLLLPGATFKGTLQHLFVNENWWYGQPFLPISAAALIIPRLVYGMDFVSQKAINLLFLRQFVSVLPMILSIILLVYIVTRFKSAWYSIGMYIFMLLIPGVVKYCYRFWHPDSLVLLLVVLTIFFLQRDRLRFRRYFYLAAVMCGLAVAIKLWGFFFFLTIGGYLLAGLLRKVVNLKQVLIRGFLFILVMALAVILSSPSLFIPWSFEFMVFGLQLQNTHNTQGYGEMEPDPEGVYQTGLSNWLRYFDYYFMSRAFFFFAFFSLIVGSLIGSEVSLNRVFLSWCVVTIYYLVTFLAVKSFHYMIPAMIPLYAGAFLLPAVAKAEKYPRWLAFLAKPEFSRIAMGITLLVIGIQFVLNLINIFTSTNIGVFARM